MCLLSAAVREDGARLTGENLSVRLASLPWAVKESDITSFLYGSAVTRVQLGREADRPSGDAIVVLRSQADVTNALKFHKQPLGGRNVDVTEFLQENNSR